MKKSKKRLTSILLGGVLFIVLFVVTYVIIFDKFSVNDISEIIKTADLRYLLIACTMIFIYLFAYGYFAKTVVGVKGCKVSILKSFVYACADFYYSAITPSATGGQPMVVYYMSFDNIPAAAGTFSTVIHTAVYKLVLLVLNLFMLIFFFPVWIGGGWVFITVWCVSLLLDVLLVLGVLLSMLRNEWLLKFGKKIIAFLSKIHIMRKKEKKIEAFERFIAEYRLIAQELKGKKKLISKLIITVFIQRVSYFSVAFLVYLALGKSDYGYFYFLAVQCFIALGVDSLPLPGGMGANEAAMIMMYENTFGAEEAASAMLLIRLINFYFGLAVSAVVSMSVYLYRLLSRKRKV